MVQSKYQFYEIVRVSRNCTRFEQLVGQVGAIMGMAQNEQGKWSYSVHLYEMDEGWHPLEDELELTGRMSSHEDHYDGSHITVVTTPDTGEGRVTGYYQS